ncbi:hypothetical protein FD755_023054, partial [Muntiacus reevesi]
PSQTIPKNEGEERNPENLLKSSCKASMTLIPKPDKDNTQKENNRLISLMNVSALGLHLPDPPLESEDEDEEGATALNSHSSIPMGPEHAELRFQPGLQSEISDAQWEDVVQNALQARQAAPV